MLLTYILLTALGITGLALLVLGAYGLNKSYTGIFADLDFLKEKYAYASRRCFVCGSEVWVGYDGYKANGRYYCGSHVPRRA